MNYNLLTYFPVSPPPVETRNLETTTETTTIFLEKPLCMVNVYGFIYAYRVEIMKCDNIDSPCTGVMFNIVQFKKSLNKEDMYDKLVQVYIIEFIKFFK